jgi:hypothetical protein
VLILQGFSAPPAGSVKFDHQKVALFVLNLVDPVYIARMGTADIEKPTAYCLFYATQNGIWVKAGKW